jgi:hypothetical protein
VFDGQCDITIHSRRACRYCRLKKCFSIGMERELLRASHQRQGTQMKQSTNKTKTLSRPLVIHSLDLLQNDRSLLTSEQWSYISNVTNAYNTKSPVPHIRRLIETQSIYPMKIRVKMAVDHLLDIITSMYLALSPFIDSLSHFATLSLNDRSVLIDGNLKNTCGFSGIGIFRDSDVYYSVAFKVGFPSIYGPAFMNEGLRIYERTDNDTTLIKFQPVQMILVSRKTTLQK